ncbi:hypothetical protein ACB092_09G100100 [Castanea dentata]
MAQLSAPQAYPLWVISPYYCAPYPVDLGIVRKVLTVSDSSFVVTDTNGNTLFSCRIIVDAAGNPIVTIQDKVLIAHNRWQAFRGESTDSKNLLFSARTRSMLYLKTKLDVYFAHNTTEKVCDFKVEGSWLDRSCVIYAGGSSTVIAKMHKKDAVQSILIGNDNFIVTVYPNIDYAFINPNIDYAFIVALIVILDEINNSSTTDIVAVQS